MSEVTEPKQKVTALVRTYTQADGQYKVVFYDFQTGINAWATNADCGAAESLAQAHFLVEYRNLMEEKAVELEIE